MTASEKAKREEEAEMEMKEMNTKVLEKTSKVTELETTNSALTQRLKELQDQMDDQARNLRADMAKKDNEIDNLKEQLTAHTKEKEELLEINIARDTDFEKCSKLLDGAESRLGMFMSGEADLTDGGRGIKRKRLSTRDSGIHEVGGGGGVLGGTIIIYS